MSDLPVRNVLAVCKPSGSHYLPSRDCLGDVMNACRTLSTGRVTCPSIWSIAVPLMLASSTVLQLMRHSVIRTLFSDQRWADAIVLLVLLISL